MGELPFSKAVIEEEIRRREIVREIRGISQCLLNQIKKFEDINKKLKVLKKEVLAALDTDMKMQNSLMDYLNQNYKDQTSKSLKRNLNAAIIRGAKQFIKSNFEKIVKQPIDSFIRLDPDRQIMFDDTKNILGTSKINFIQVGIIRILSLLLSANRFNDLESIFRNYNIWDLNTSPLIQTFQFPEGFDISNLEGFENWFYFYKDNLSPPQGELLIFTLGYSVGGSRSDDRYQNKYLRTEDCSSSIAKWINSSCSFTTRHMQFAAEGNLNNSSACAVLENLSLKSIENIKIGDILLIRSAEGGHTGFISYINDDKSWIETLSYSRKIPEKEGLGYCRLKITESYNFYFFEYKENKPNIQDNID